MPNRTTQRHRLSLFYAPPKFLDWIRERKNEFTDICGAIVGSFNLFESSHPPTLLSVLVMQEEAMRHYEEALALQPEFAAAQL